MKKSQDYPGDWEYWDRDDFLEGDDDPYEWTCARDSGQTFDRFLFVARFMTKEQRREWLIERWTSNKARMWGNRQRLAIEYFKEAGYLGTLPQPEAELTLYRGSSKPRYRLGLSWTTSIDVARRFVEMWFTGGIVYSAIAPPEAILGGFDEREEAEYVVDPKMLRAVKRIEVIPVPV